MLYTKGRIKLTWGLREREILGLRFSSFLLLLSVLFTTEL